MSGVRLASIAAGAAAAIAVLASGAIATDLPVIPGVKTKLSVKAIPIVCPLTGVDGQATFFGLTLPTQSPPPCLGKAAKASAKIVASAGTVTATIKVSDKEHPNDPIDQTVTLQSRLHPDGCGPPDSILPQLTFSGAGQGLPPGQLVNGKAVITVTSDQILNGNPGLFPSPRPLCPSDVFTIIHLLRINGCCYQAIFTVHHAG
jgi:hypothetical protein